MMRLLSTTCLGLVLAAAGASAQSLDEFAAQGRAAMPQAAPLPLDQLIGPDADMPVLADLPTEARADMPDPAGGGIDAALWAEFGLAEAEAVGDIPAPVPAQAAATGGSDIVPAEPPADWVWHELQGTRFATPGDMQVMEQTDDEIALFRGTMEPPTGIVLMLGLESGPADTWEEMLADMRDDGMTASATGEIRFADGRVFDWADVTMTDSGIAMRSRLFMSRDLFGEYEDVMLIAGGSVGDIPPIDDATLATFLASVRLGPSVPRVADAPSTGDYGYILQPSVMQPALGGLVTLPVPDGWTFAETGGEAVLTAPGGIGTIRFARGAGARAIVAGIDRGISETPTWMAGGMARGYETATSTALIWETCPAPGDPLAMLAAGAPGFLEDAGYGAVLSWLGVAMPAGALPCGAEIAPGATSAPAEVATTVPQTAAGGADVGGVLLTLPGGWISLYEGPSDAMWRSADDRYSLVATWRPAGTELVPASAVTATTRATIGGEGAVMLQSAGPRAAAVGIVERPRADGRQFMLMLDAADTDPATLVAELTRLGAGVDFGATLVPVQGADAGGGPGTPSDPSTPGTDAVPASGDPDRFTDLGGGYSVYSNGRYPMEISYPGTYFTAREAPGNGDGRSFDSVDGQAHFLVFSQYDALDQGLEGMLADARPMLDSVTTEVSGPGYFTIGGTQGTDMVLRKVIMDADGLTRTFEITYPATRAEEFRAVVTYMADSFGPAPTLTVAVPQPPQAVAVPQPPQTVAVPQPPAGAATIPTSAVNRVTDFADGTDHGWTGLRLRLTPEAVGGPNGGGHLANFAPGDGEDGYYIAPPAFHGDWTGLTAVEVTIRSVAGEYYGDTGPAGTDLVISNGSLTARTGFDSAVGADWATYSVPLSDARPWRLEGGATSLAQILANVTDFRIRGEYNIGDTTGSLGRVAVVGGQAVAAPPVAAPPVAGVPQHAPGVWAIQTNTGYSGRLTLAYGPDGLSGYVYFDAHGRDEILADMTFDPATGALTFLRPGVNQEYRITISGDQMQGEYNSAPGTAFIYALDGSRIERDDFLPDGAQPGVASVAPVEAPQTGSVIQPGTTGGPVTIGPLTTPARGTAERAALMDAARGPIQGLLGVPVIFVVSVLNTDGNWAYLQATPVNPDGTAIDWYRTPYGRDIADGFMSDVAMVLMHREDGRWQAFDYTFGPTDVAWYDWVQRYGLPERLFMN